MEQSHDSQSSRVIYLLSQRIVSGELSAGEKLAEIPVAEHFGVSRTPVRQALAALEREGLLVRDQSRSYVVRRFSLQEILDAIEVRAVLEGLAASQVAYRRLPWSLLREFEVILADAEGIIGEIEVSGPTVELTTRYYNANERFHTVLMERANNRVISSALAAASKVPFAAVGSMARYTGSTDDNAAQDREKSRLLLLSHMQHQDIFEALKAGDAARADSLMREHAHIGIRNLHLNENYASRPGIGGVLGAAVPTVYE